MNLTVEDIDLLEQWWIEKSRKNFLAYRQFIRGDSFTSGWFMNDLCKNLQQFYLDLISDKRPILIIQTPPQHGKSWTIADFISWLSGKLPSLRTIYATYSDTLGVRCNKNQQRVMDSEKYKKIFPITKLPQKKGGATRNNNLLEFVKLDGDKEKPTDGQFRNTTVAGSVTGESLDLGVIDDAVKGREQANSETWSQRIWDWFTDDFGTRFSEWAGLLIIMTRWTVHDIIGRLKKEKDIQDRIKIVNYAAIATKDEKYRKSGKPLFPELKSLEFLMGRKAVMNPAHWEALYQGAPTIAGGNMFKDHYWGWWKVLPQLKYKFIVADTAQKKNEQNDWTCFHCWGYGVDDRIYLLDKFRARLEAPELRREAFLFYQKHNTPRTNIKDPILRGFYIEDKSSGIGLIQELKRKKVKVFPVQRNTDKVFRAEDVIPEIAAGKVLLNENIPGVGNLTKEGREFPNGEFDDDIDNLMTAVEVAFINKTTTNLLQAAMEMENN